MQTSYFTWKNIIEKLSYDWVEGYVYYIVIFIAIFMSYLLLKPITNWLVILKSINLLSYLMSGLFVLFLLLLATFTIEKLNDSLMDLFKVFLQCLACFGLTLILYKTFWRKEKRYNKS
jgi:hypothetical protein